MSDFEFFPGERAFKRASAIASRATGTFTAYCPGCRVWHVVYGSGAITNHAEQPAGALHQHVTPAVFVERIRWMQSNGYPVTVCRGRTR